MSQRDTYFERCSLTKTKKCGDGNDILLYKS